MIPSTVPVKVYLDSYMQRKYHRYDEHCLLYFPNEIIEMLRYFHRSGSRLYTISYDKGEICYTYISGGAYKKIRDNIPEYDDLGKSWMYAINDVSLYNTSEGMELRYIVSILVK